MFRGPQGTGTVSAIPAEWAGQFKCLDLVVVRVPVGVPETELRV